MASDATVTNRASTDRLLRTAPQVRLTTPTSSYRTITETSSLFRTHALPLNLVRICVREECAEQPRAIRENAVLISVSTDSP
jgi:hypothetical protein